MAVLLNTGAIASKKNIVIDPRIQVIFNDRLSDAQIKSGILAKVTIVHPCFSTRATVFKSENGTIRIIGSSMKTGDNDWFNIVLLEPAFRDHLLEMYKEFKAGKLNFGAWYLQMKGDKVIHVSEDNKNETIDLEEVILNANLSDKQVDSGMVAKVSVKTPVATLRGVSVFKSKHGHSLYLVEQNEQDNIPAYTLSRECEAQVLNYIHSLVTDWGVDKPREERPAPAQSAEKAVETPPAGVGAVDADKYYQ